MSPITEVDGRLKVCRFGYNVRLRRLLCGKAQRV